MNTKHAEDNFCLSVRPHINEEHCFQPISPLVKSDLVSNLVLSDGGLVLQGFSVDLITLKKKATLNAGSFWPCWPVRNDDRDVAAQLFCLLYLFIFFRKAIYVFNLSPNNNTSHLEALYIVAKDLNSSFLSAVVQAESTFVQLVNVIHKFTFKILFSSLIIKFKIISGSIFKHICA